MGRYSVIGPGLTPQECEAVCREYGGTNITCSSRTGICFCTLEEAQAERLARDPRVSIRPVGEVRHQQLAPAQVFAGSQSVLSSLIFEARSIFTPPLTGEGYVVAVLDTGIRDTHATLRGKVVDAIDFTGEGTTQDVFDHGTAVAFLIAGGRAAEGEEQGFAPGARLLNFRVLGASGQGTDEAAVMAIDECISRRESLPKGHEKRPNLINISFGGIDDGNPNHPLRVACRAAVQAGMGVVAAAGNMGPTASSVSVPATDPEVLAIGAVLLNPFQIWTQSSRGPTLEGTVKPDLVTFGVNLLLASAAGDESFTIKSGTSFAAPAVSGMAAIAREMASRVLGMQGEDFGVEEAYQVLPSITKKPSDAPPPPSKDNTYGYGSPFGDLLLKVLGASGAPDLGSMLNSVMPLLGLGLVAPAVASLGRSLAARKE